MATLRKKRKLEVASRETQENARNSQSLNMCVPGMIEGYITQFVEEIEGRITGKVSQQFSRTESRILEALSRPDNFLLNP